VYTLVSTERLRAVYRAAHPRALGRPGGRRDEVPRTRSPGGALE
jgi:hypothetical protein